MDPTPGKKMVANMKRVCQQDNKHVIYIIIDIDIDIYIYKLLHIHVYIYMHIYIYVCIHVYTKIVAFLFVSSNFQLVSLSGPS